MNRLKGLTVLHRNYRAALEKLEAYMHFAEPGDLIVLTGPSRCGKSTVITEAVKTVLGCREGNENFVPTSIKLNATNAGRHGTFDTRYFMKSMLRAVHHPFYSQGEINTEVDLYVLEKNRRTTEQEFRDALERAILTSPIRFIIVDEAQHAAYASSEAAGGLRVLDSWKTLAADTGTILILVGAYPLLQIMKRSPHMLGRMHQIHFPRYGENGDDIREFSRILMRFEEIMNYLPMGFLVKNLEHLHKNSLGCIGLLAAWLKRFNAIQVSEMNSEPTVEKLLDVKIAGSDLDVIFKEIAVGEGFYGDAVYGSGSKKPANFPTGKGKPFKKRAKRIKVGVRS